MPLILSGSVDISGSMTATTIVVSTPGAAGMVSSSAQIRELVPLMQATASLNSSTSSLIAITNGLMAVTASMKAASIVSSSSQLSGTTITNLTVTNLTTVGQTGGYGYYSSGYVNETQTITNNASSYYLIKSTGTSNGSSLTTFNITGMSTTNGTCADIYVIAQKDATAGAINTNITVQINGNTVNLPTLQAGGTGANTVRCSFRVCRMESTWVVIGNPNTSYF